MAYLHHVPGLQQSLQSGVSNTLELDQRKPAVDKFLARAEIAMVSLPPDFDASSTEESLRVLRSAFWLHVVCLLDRFIRQLPYSPHNEFLGPSY
jgi:hypothetical protein